MLFWQILLNSLVLGTQVLLLAVPLYLVHAVSRIYHLALGVIGIAAAYGVYFGLSQGFSWGLSSAIGIVVAAVLSSLSCFLLESSVRKGEKMFGLLLSLGMLVGLEALLSMIFHTDAKSLIEGVLPTLSYGSLYVTVPGAITLLAGIVLAVIFTLLLSKTPWGRDLRGIAENSSLAASISINSSRVRLSVFIIAGILAGFVAVMTTMNTALSPTGGLWMVILAFVALLIGGLTDIRGLIIASYLTTLIPQLIINLSSASFSISAHWNMVIVFLLATLILLWRPQGLLVSNIRQD